MKISFKYSLDLRTTYYNQAFIDSFERYKWINNLAIWLDESILTYNFCIGILSGMEIAQENWELEELLF